MGSVCALKYNVTYALHAVTVNHSDGSPTQPPSDTLLYNSFVAITNHTLVPPTGRGRRRATPTANFTSRATGKRFHVRTLQRVTPTVRLESSINSAVARCPYLIAVVPVMETLVRVTSIRRWVKYPLVFTHSRQLVMRLGAQEIHVNGGTVCPLPVPCIHGHNNTAVEGSNIAIPVAHMMHLASSSGRCELLCTPAESDISPMITGFV